MKACCLIILLFQIPLQLSLADPPANQTAQSRPVKGLIVVYDGSTLRENSKTYEYSQLQRNPQTFKATLSSGVSVSGMSSQVVAILDYERKDVVKMLAEAEKISAFFSKAKPILAVRIPQLRERYMLKRDGGDTTTEQVASINKANRPTEIRLPEAPAQQKSHADKSSAETFESSNGNRGSHLNVIMQLAMSPKTADFQILKGATQDKDAEIQKWGIRGIGKLKSKPSLDRLVEMSRMPGITLKNRKEIVKVIVGFISDTNQELALPAVDALCEIAKEANPEEGVGSEAIQQISVCFESGTEQIRALIESKDFPVIKNVVSQAKQRKAEICQREAELKNAAEAFTAGDRKLLKGYATGDFFYFLSDGSRIPVKYTHFASGARISSDMSHSQFIQHELVSVANNIRNGWVYCLGGKFRFDEYYKILQREQTLLATGDPKQIAFAALIHLNHLRGILERTEGDRTKEEELFTNHDVTYNSGNGNTYTETQSRLNLGAIFGGGGEHTQYYIDALTEFNELRSMLGALSPSARKQLDLPEHPAGRESNKIEDTTQTFNISQFPIGCTIANCSGKVSVNLIFSRDKRHDRIYDHLLANKLMIEDELGLPLVWKSDEECQSIVASSDFGDPMLPQNEAKAQKWLNEIKNRFINTFRPRIVHATSNQ